MKEHSKFSKIGVEKKKLLHLPKKYVFTGRVSRACRCDELSKMLLDDTEDQDNVLIVHIPDSKKKTRRFVIVDEGNLALYFVFLNYKQVKCTVQPGGLHSFRKFPSKVATYLKLPTPLAYTGHCMRRSSATVLVDAGGANTILKRHGRWYGTTVAEGNTAISRSQSKIS